MLTVTRPTARSTGQSQYSMINQKYRRGYSIPLLPHQKDAGIRVKTLWPSRNQIIRIIPGYDPVTGEVFKQNVHVNEFSDENDRSYYLSDTFMKAPVITRFGQITSPIISAYPPGSPEDQTYAGETVLRNFVRGISYACMNKGGKGKLKPTNEWKIWTQRGPGALLSFDKEALLMQALVFVVNGSPNKDYETQQELRDGDGDILPILSVCIIDSQTSMANLYEALVVPSDRRKPLDAATNNQYGPMAEMEGNKLFLNTYQDAVKHASALRPSVQPGGEGWTPTPFPLGEDAVKALWHPWNDLLAPFMTATEQVELCAREFGKDTVNYVLGTDPRFSELIPEDIRKEGFGRYASLVGGSVTINSNQPFQASAPATATPAVSSAKGLGVGIGRPASQPVRAPETHNAQPEVPLTTVDVHALMEATKAIRQASANKTQAEDAQDLLDNPLLGG